MNIVRNHIVEKFKEDSDPIKDMGIGMAEKLKPYSLSVLTAGYLDNYRYLEKFMNIPIENIYTLGRYENSINVDSMLAHLLKHSDTKLLKENDYYSGISKLLLYQTYKGKIALHKNKFQILALGDIGAAYFNYFGNVNEKFTEEGDPIHDMGIGLLEQISEYFRKKTHNNRFNFEEYTRGSIRGINAIICKLIEDNKSIEWIEFLLQMPGADIKICQTGYALEWASYKNNVEMIKLLLRYGIDINGNITIHSSYGGAIGNAIYGNSLDALECLINNGAKVYQEQIDYAELEIYNENIRAKAIEILKKGLSK